MAVAQGRAPLPPCRSTPRASAHAVAFQWPFEKTRADAVASKLNPLDPRKPGSPWGRLSSGDDSVLSQPMLFDPPSHERLTERRWDEPRARAAIAAIAADTEAAFDEGSLWPAHPHDEKVGRRPRLASLYLGASGVIWALHELERVGAAELRRDWAPVAVRLAEDYPFRPDFDVFVEGPVPSLWMGEAGILLVAHTLAPAAWQAERLS